jgi:hypothetical protein
VSIQDLKRSFGALVCTKGPLSGQTFAITPEGFWIGRDSAVSQVVVNVGAISKRHVWVGPRDGEIKAFDESSTNGTYLNTPAKSRIREVALSEGDVLILADDMARFEYRSGAK